MIEIVNGNLLESNANLLLHQVNCMGKMGKGLALQIKQQYPIVYEKYQIACSALEPNELLGKIQVCKINESQSIVNVFSQMGFGYGKRYTDYQAMREAFTKIADLAREEGYTIGLPYNYGCGLGGGNWKKVYDIIEEVYYDVDVTIYKLEDK